MNISEEVLIKYELPTLESFIEATGMDEKEYYKLVLYKTDHIPNKIIESLVENLASATLATFIGVFINFIKQIRVDYYEILTYRKLAREEINKIESEQVTE